MLKKLFAALLAMMLLLPMCAYAAPEVFAIVGRHSTVIAQPEPGRSGRVSDAANGCPVNAIRVTR